MGNSRATIVAIAITTFFAMPAAADSIADFYTNNRITFVVGAGPAGGYDLYSRVFAEHVSRHIPGNPNIVVQNMQGAGGARAADYLARVAPKDGSVIGMPIAATLISEALTPDTSRYRLREFGWVGTISTMTDVLGVNGNIGVTTIEQAKSREIVLGSTAGKLSQTWFQPALVNALLHTKFKIVGGYQSMNHILLAQERGEVQGHTNPWVSWITQRPDLIKNGTIKFLIQFGPKVAQLPNIPTFIELVKTAEERRLVDFVGLMQFMGRSIAMPPGAPPERLAALRKAFQATVKDPAFIAAMEAKKMELIPRTGEQFQADLDEISPTMQDTARSLKSLLKL